MKKILQTLRRHLPALLIAVLGATAVGCAPAFYDDNPHFSHYRNYPPPPPPHHKHHKKKKKKPAPRPKPDRHPDRYHGHDKPHKGKRHNR